MVRVIEQVDEFEALSPRWDDLARRSRATPFLLSAYLAEVWRRTPARVYCVVAERGGRLVGGLPLRVQGRRWTREAALLAGAHRSNLLCDPGEPRGTSRALLDAARELPLDWLQVYGVGPDTALARTLPERALRPQREQVFHLDMPDGWESAYRQIASSKRRTRDRRNLRKLGEQGEVRFEVATEPDHVQRILTDAFDVYGRRWQGEAGESGGFGSGEQSWRAVATRMAASGHLLVVLLGVAGEPVAFTYNFMFNGTLWGHRLAYARTHDAFSPGRLTLLHTFATAAQAGAKRVDLGLGSDPYKATLATGSSPLLWGTAVTHGPNGAIAARLDKARFSARQRAKQSDAVLRVRQRLFGLRRYLPARA